MEYAAFAHFKFWVYRDLPFLFSLLGASTGTQVGDVRWWFLHIFDALLPSRCSRSTLLAEHAARGASCSWSTLLAESAAPEARFLRSTLFAAHAAPGVRCSRSKLLTEYAARRVRCSRSTLTAQALLAEYAYRGARCSRTTERAACGVSCSRSTLLADLSGSFSGFSCGPQKCGPLLFHLYAFPEEHKKCGPL